MLRVVNKSNSTYYFWVTFSRYYSVILMFMLCIHRICCIVLSAFRSYNVAMYNVYIMYFKHNIAENRKPYREFLHGSVGFSLKMCHTVFTCLVTGHYVNYILLYTSYCVHDFCIARGFFCHGNFQSVMRVSIDVFMEVAGIRT